MGKGKDVMAIPEIRNIVFDMGRTLIDWNPEKIAEAAGVPEDETERFVRETFCGYEWTAADRGILSDDDVVAAACRRLPEHLHENVRTAVTGWWNLWSPKIPGMEELVRELKKNGYRIYLLSNASSHVHEFFDRLPASDCFDGKFISADWKLMKPSHEIYEAFCAHFGLVPKESLFVDDAPWNIEGAIITGMQGIVFYGDAKRLRREMRERGIAVAEER
ncbi:putative hydrolase of the HAD superfamily [[Clostridium] aminophilum]|uniref:Putative hydrolase of the HAD superfamily n=2 Tax=[Clostridium] aminophilum TaxID=1526 RepID=A0A1I6J5N2_9FIRM|nr:putative hydrolase of the HAD superfamily [[Clostridium] aminophilum]